MTDWIKRRGLAALLTALWMGAVHALGQTQAPSDEVRVSSRPYVPPSVVVHVDANLVQVGVVVRDAKGRAVSGLKQEDFRILDQGKQRDISSFTVDVLSERAAPAPTPSMSGPAAAPAALSVGAPPPAIRPRFIALYFDDFGTPTGDLMRTKAASKRFVEDGLSPGDRAAVFTSSAGRITDYSADKTRIIAAIEKVQAHPRFSENGLAACPRITPYDAYLIANNMGTTVIQVKVQELQACSGTQSDTPILPISPGLGGSAKFSLPTYVGRGEREQVVAQAEQTWNLAKLVAQNTLEDIRAAVDDLARRPGTRMLLLVSSGFLAGTLQQDQDRVVNDALRAEVVINALDAKGLFVEAPGRPFTADSPLAQLPPQVFGWETMSAVAAKEVPSEVLSDLAAATGGLFFHHNNDYSFGFRELGALPEVTYLLGFRLGEMDADGKYHNLKVRLASNGHAGYAIEARPGYYALAGAKPPAPAALLSPDRDLRGRLDAKVQGTDSIAEFPVKVAVRFGDKQPSGATRLSVEFHVELAGLHFLPKNDRHTEQLTLVAALFDAEGKLVAAKEGTMEFSLKDATYQRLTQAGVNASLTFEAVSGSYRLRTVAQDAVDNKFAASGYSLQVP